MRLIRESNQRCMNISDSNEQVATILHTTLCTSCLNCSVFTDNSDEVGVAIGYTCSFTDKSWKGYASLCNGLSVESNWRSTN